jgi:hypothetical protein
VTETAPQPGTLVPRATREKTPPSLHSKYFSEARPQKVSDQQIRHALQLVGGGEATRAGASSSAVIRSTFYHRVRTLEA